MQPRSASNVLFSYHDNDVHFLSKAFNFPAFGGSSYTINEYSITSNQDPNGKIRAGNRVPFTTQDQMGQLRFTVGRKGSRDVANWWKGRVSASQTTFNHDPDSLNFAFLGSLELKVFNEPDPGWLIQDIALGQGTSGTSNNWWFGGKNCQHTDDNTVRCTGFREKRAPADFYFGRGGNSADEVQLKRVDFHD
ncbi:hypothetical protein PM082_021477 [Marasmius tenuissimus]|nr:hypothetical protein PM082_021477 [Marasmius tenuissimus]